MKNTVLKFNQVMLFFVLISMFGAWNWHNNTSVREGYFDGDIQRDFYRYFGLIDLLIFLINPFVFAKASYNFYKNKECVYIFHFTVFILCILNYLFLGISSKVIYR